MIKIFDNAEELSIAAAELMISASKDAIQKTGKFLVSLSGGSTPKRVFEILAQPSFKDRIDWSKVYIFWGDERCVPFEDTESNAGMTYKALLDHVAVPGNQVFRIKGELPPHDAATEYNELLEKFFPEGSTRSFDLVFLGMGTDGHTASLFPYTPVLEERSRLAKEVYLEELKKLRVTITQDLINNADKIAFLITGENKAEVLNEVMYGQYNYKKYPSQLIKPRHGELLWFLDKGAARIVGAK
jgi:6-phosphogluconolactonase